MAMSEMDDYEEPEEIETSIPCPVCESKVFLISYTTEIPVEGRISIETYLCRKCLYRKSNIYYDESENPRKLIFRVESPSDLGTMIYRSSSASIKIPEIDAEIIPGEISSGELTTAEGILQRILDRIPTMRDEGIDSTEIESFLMDAINATRPVTIVIEDRTGKSTIESDRVRIEPLD